jgi:nicotinate (nicotinamide) nucleotide adenylyltransferase
MGNGADKIISVLNAYGIPFCDVFASDGFVRKKLFHSVPISSYAELKEKHNEGELFLLIGDDWIDRFDKWKDYKFILDNAHLVIAYRNEKDISESVKRLKSASGKEIYLLENKRIELSSTNLRTAPKKELLPDGVFDYIQKRGLYGI